MKCALVLAVAALALPAQAAAQYAPVDRPGPPLTEPADQLAAALTCSNGLDGATRAPVLLVHGTGATVEENWSWNYQPAFDHLGIEWCAVQLPERGQGDLQRNGEYVVHAIREMHRRAGRKVSVIGHSQGGMLPRWPLRFWPDTRAMVDDQIGFAASNHGTQLAGPSCATGCSPSGWQQASGSRFLEALNSYQETFAGISYTMVYTRVDEIVRPPEGAALHTGDGRITNVAIQDICPVAVSEHFAIGIMDTIAFALAMDALNNDGPASVERVAADGCFQQPIPNLDPTGLIRAAISYGIGEGGADEVPAEPELRCFVTATCDASGARRALTVSVSPRRVTAGRSVLLRVRVRARGADGLEPVAGARVAAGHARRSTRSDGRAQVRMRFRRAGRHAVTARAAGFAPGRSIIRAVAPR